MLQTGAFVPIDALGEKKHAYRRLMLSSLAPFVCVPKPRMKKRVESRKLHFYANIRGYCIGDAP